MEIIFQHVILIFSQKCVLSREFSSKFQPKQIFKNYSAKLYCASPFLYLHAKQHPQRFMSSSVDSVLFVSVWFSGKSEKGKEIVQEGGVL